jgi:hypothetical protein
MTSLDLHAALVAPSPGRHSVDDLLDSYARHLIRGLLLIQFREDLDLVVFGGGSPAYKTDRIGKLKWKYADLGLDLEGVEGSGGRDVRGSASRTPDKP